MDRADSHTIQAYDALILFCSSPMPKARFIDALYSKKKHRKRLKKDPLWSQKMWEQKETILDGDLYDMLFNTAGESLGELMRIRSELPQNDPFYLAFDPAVFKQLQPLSHASIRSQFNCTMLTQYKNHQLPNSFTPYPPLNNNS